MSGIIRRWVDGHPYGALVFLTLAVLCPLLAKPFNVDDPLFIWAAQQIEAHPGNPYGFEVNWYGTPQPMWTITQNPPGACYFLALAGALVGWGEIGQHGALLLPAIAAILGTWRLARHLCGQPLLAATITLCTPVFLVSANTVMCDVMMLACWVWAAVFWVEGFQTGSARKLPVAGCLIALAALTKYYGICLVPLLAAYAVISHKPVKRWLPFLLLPLAILGAYEYAMVAGYGSGLQGAVQYVRHHSTFDGSSKIDGTICGLAFAGGGLAAVTFFASLLWHRRSLFALTAVMGLIFLLLWFYTGFWGKYDIAAGPVLIRAKMQMAFWMTAGLGILALAAADTWQRRDANSTLLLLWVLGTFSFASFCNWTVNGRSILPMVPAVAILIVRRLELKSKRRPKAIWLATALCLMFAFLVACADFSGAAAVRRSTEDVLEKYAQSSRGVWFQGHWGFQYYMNAAGAAAVDFNEAKRSGIPGEVIVIPEQNTNIRLPSATNAVLLDVFKVAVPARVAVWSRTLGAGFYDAGYGPLPFAFGTLPPETVFVYSPVPALIK
ncbi:MAG: glycosyltransferase family 39 protein [Verrucomicrobiae bacterium]|nr:glycosyltransferase family 39 protein [Verrucomicrobiae bacterium]